MDPFLRRVMEQRAREQAVFGPLDVLQRLDEERMRVLTAQTRPRYCRLCRRVLRGENAETKLCTRCGGVKRSLKMEREGTLPPVVSEEN